MFSNEISHPKFTSTIVAVVLIHRIESGTLTHLCVPVFISMIDESLQQCNLLKIKWMLGIRLKLINQSILSMFSCQAIFGVCHNFFKDKTFASVPPESTLST